MIFLIKLKCISGNISDPASENNKRVYFLLIVAVLAFLDDIQK